MHIYAKVQNFIKLSLNLTKLCHIKCNHRANFHLTTHLAWTLLFDDTVYQISSKTANSSVRIFLRGTCVQTFAKTLTTLLIVVCGKSSQICCSALLAPEWSWALSGVCEMPEELHPTHDRQVGWGLVNLVAIHHLRWSRYSGKWKFTGLLRLIWHNSVNFRDNWIQFCNLP